MDPFASMLEWGGNGSKCDDSSSTSNPTESEPTNKEKPSFDSTFEVVRTIQKALYGRVVLARHRATGVERAVKIVKKRLAASRRTAHGAVVQDDVEAELAVGRLVRDNPARPPGLLELAPEDATAAATAAADESVTT